MNAETASLVELLQHWAQAGRVHWLGGRAEKWQAMQVVDSIRLTPEQGIVGDHYSGRSGKRQVTLFQADTISLNDLLEVVE